MTDTRTIRARALRRPLVPAYEPILAPVEIPEAHYRFTLLPDYLAARAVERELFQSGIANPYFRSIESIAGATATIAGRSLINYASYNYLGFSGDPRVSEAAVQAIAQYGTSASASRLASGDRPIHRELEAELARVLGTEDAVTFVSGHATNVTVIGHLFGRKDLILHDALIHNSVLQGSVLSGAKRVTFRTTTGRRPIASSPSIARFRARADRDRGRLQHGRRHPGPAALHRAAQPPSYFPDGR